MSANSGSKLRTAGSFYPQYSGGPKFGVDTTCVLANDGVATIKIKRIIARTEKRDLKFFIKKTTPYYKLFTFSTITCINFPVYIKFVNY
jgi:hypothetical protein